MQVSFGKRFLLLIIFIICVAGVTICGCALLFTQNCLQTQVVFADEEPIATSTLTLINGNNGQTIATISAEVGTTWQLPTPDKTIVGSYGETVIATKNSVKIDGGTLKTVTYQNGYYLESWTQSLGEGATCDATTFTFGTEDSTFTAIFQKKKIAVVFNDLYGRYLSHQVIEYGDKVEKPNDSLIITTTDTERYDVVWYRSDSSIMDFNSAVTPLNPDSSFVFLEPQAQAKQFIITWDANFSGAGGSFYQGSEEETPILQTTTPYNKPYVLPDVNPTRFGYDFTGWYSVKDNLKLDRNKTLSDITNLTFKAGWKEKSNLTVSFSADNNVLQYDIAKSDSVGITRFIKGQPDIKFSTIKGCTVFSLSKIVYEGNWVFYELEFYKQSGVKAINGIDYKLTKENNQYSIEIGNSITVKVTSCMMLSLVALTNFEQENKFVESDIGGTISIGENNLTYSSRQQVLVKTGDSVWFNAKLNPAKKAKFRGFYASDSYDTGDKEILLQDPISTSLNFLYPNVIESNIIYAVFEFQYFNVEIFTYSDEINFEGKTSTDLLCDDNMGTAMIISNNKSSSIGSSVSLKVPEGEFCSSSVTVKEYSFAYAKYEFVGYYESLKDLIDDKSNTPIEKYSFQNIDICVTKNIVLYAKFVKKYALVISALDDGIETLSVGTETSSKEIRRYYDYNQQIIDEISCKVGEGYQDTVVWKVNEDESIIDENPKSIINSCTSQKLITPITSFVMKDNVIKISVSSKAQQDIPGEIDPEKVKIDIDFEVTGVDLISDFVCVTSSENDILSFPFSVNKAEDFVCYIKIFKRFFLTKDDINFSVDDENLVVKIKDDDITPLSILDKETYSEKYKITISNITKDCKITILGDSEETTLNFANLVNFDKGVYEENAFWGHIKYCTSDVAVENQEWLCPKIDDLIFGGWSTNKSTSGLVLDENGKLIEKYWTSLSDEVTLYPVFTPCEVNVKFSVSTLEGLANKDGFTQDVMKSVPLSSYKKVDDNIYFNVGTTFVLSVPKLKNKYQFYGYQYYIVEDGKIEIKHHYIDAENEQGEIVDIDSISLFTIGSYSNYQYSNASNFDNYSNLEDGIMYIEYILQIEIELIATNYYPNAVTGGTLSILNDVGTTKAFYNQVLQIKANCDTGYEISHWYINSTMVDSVEDSFEFTLKKPTTIKVVFIGKLVEIAFGEAEHGVGQTITGVEKYRESDNHYFARVGSDVTLYAKSNEGYESQNKWLHSNSKILTSSKYKITEQDGQDGLIILTPLFVVRDLDVNIYVPKNIVSLYQFEEELSHQNIGKNWLYSFTIKYFDDVEFSFLTKQKYAFKSAFLTTGTEEINITNKVANTVVKFGCEYYNNSANLTINLNFEELYWQSYLLENDIVEEVDTAKILKKDFAGSGRSTDPYRIDNATDLAKLAYVINNNVTQTNLNKRTYNSPLTYYEINFIIFLEERFWTPIGTSENPFNSVISIYYMPTNMEINSNDPNIPASTSLDELVLDEYNNLFGALGEDAKILLQSNNFILIYIILGATLLVIIIIIIILAIIRKRRKEQIKNFDEHNKFLFDIE